MNFKVLFTSAALMLSTTTAFAQKPDDYAEYLRSIPMAGNDLNINVPSDYFAASTILTVNQQNLGFVLDNETADQWSRYIGVNIIMKPDRTVKQKMDDHRAYLERTYGSVKVSSYRFADYMEDRNYQYAEAVFTYTDEESAVSTAIEMYSDFDKLVSVQSSIRSQKTSSRVASTAKKLTDSVLQLSRE